MEKCLPVRKRTVRIAAALSALSVATLANPAHAGLEAVIAPIAPVVIDAVSRCPIAPQPLAPALAPAPLTKTAALLGGAPSALDLIRAQQSGQVAPAQPMITKAAPAIPVLTPGIDASVSAIAGCAGLAASRAVARPGLLAAVATDPENFLASKRVRIGRTNFDRDWKRVRSETLSAGVMKSFLASVSADREITLAQINSSVNQRIRYAEDRDQYGKADFWAGARRTLRSGRGDCEDIALTKMQLLAAAGIPRDDMILTIARDLVRNADHAVLIVRTDNGYRMLDNATDAVLDAAPGNDYRPILSFGSQTSWLHGV